MPRAYELKQQLTTTRQEGEFVFSYCTKLHSIWDEIQSKTPNPRCDCTGYTCELGKGLNISRDKDRLYEFLMGLESEYSTIKTHMLSTKPTPSLGMAYHLVVEDGQQQVITAGKNPSNEAATFRNFVQNRRQFGGDQKKQYKKVVQKDQPKKGSVDEPKQCTFAERRDTTKNVASSTLDI